MSEGPALPTVEDAHLLFQRGHAWHDPGFLKARLEEAGFEDVEVVQERRRVPFGTPDDVMGTVGMAIGVLGSTWEEGRREEIAGRVKEELRKVLMEEVGGEEGVLWLDMVGNVGVGWKR